MHQEQRGSLSNFEILLIVPLTGKFSASLTPTSQLLISLKFDSNRSISFTLMITPTILLLTLFHCRVLYKSFKDDEVPSSNAESIEPCLSSNLRILATFTSLALFLTLSLIAYMSTLLYSQPHLEYSALWFLYSYLLLQSPLMGRMVFKLVFESAYMSQLN